MMNKKLIIFMASISFLFACEQEETITPRDYPFVESIQVSSINETGATVEFEILKAGKSSVDSYGVEYFENDEYTGNYSPKSYVLQEFVGTPSSNLISARISYDLLKNKEYLVKPFVRSGGKTIYGNTMLFDSKGVKAPEIKEVSKSVITGNSTFTIKGDFFHSRLDFNQVAIPELGEYFSTTVLSASREELVVRLNKTNYPFPLTNNKYDLVVTSGDYTITLENYFTLGYPTLVSVYPLSAYVGDEIDFTIETFGYSNDLILQFTELSYAGNPDPKIGLYFFKKEDNAVEKRSLINLAPGKYELNLITNDANYKFTSEFEVLNSWEVYRQNSRLPLKENHNAIYTIGDKLVLDKQVNGNFLEGQIYDLKNNTVKNLNPFPFNSYFKASPLVTSDGDRYLYYGLGNDLINEEWVPAQDWNRMDITTGVWEALPKFPKTKNTVVHSFEYLGKIYVTLDDQDKFSVFDPINMVWSESTLSVPADLRKSRNVITSGNTLYFSTPTGVGSTATKKLILGQQSELLYSIAGSYYPQLALNKNKLLMTYGVNEIVEFDLISYKAKQVQSIPYFNGYSVTSWDTSEGVLFIYPINYSGYVENYDIYRLR